MQNLSLDKQLLIVLNEALDKRRLFAISFSIISIAILIVGLILPKSYEASTTLLWNTGNVLKPLLEGTVDTNSGIDQSQLVKEIIYSNKILDILIENTGLNYSPAGEKISDRESALLKAQLRKSIRLNMNINKTLTISYKSSNPDLAFRVVSVISRLFLEESTLNIKSDTQNAYIFIDKQVNEYQLKLSNITDRINKFKSENIELQVDTTRSVNDRVSNLKAGIRATSLELNEANIRKESLTEQSLIESAKSTIVEEVNVKKQRLLILQNQLSTLRLSYTEDYPDIVQIKEQIRNLTRSINSGAGTAEPLSLAESRLSGGVKPKSLLYERLQQQLSAIEITLRTLSARKYDQEKQLAFELNRSGEVSQVSNQLQELSLGYDVTRNLYDNLLVKRENARVAINLESENAGSLYEVQEPPTIPLIPQGLRFFHFVIGSIFLGTGIPLGIIFGLLMIDPRIRHEDSMDLGDAIPVIGYIPVFKTVKDLRKQRLATIQSVILFSLSLVVLVTLSLSRMYEVI